MKAFTRTVLVAFTLLFCHLYASSQAVTEIVTDFQGYWRSGVRPNTNAISPNNSHNLLSFTYNGVRYSTGVNDAILAANSLPFTAGKYKALPVSALSAAPTTGGTYIGLGQLYDGVAGGATPPPANNIPFYLTDGVSGLNLGTAVYNLPVSNLVFDIGLFNIARIGDGIPDIIVTQVGEISAGVKDTFKFIDPAGNIVGNAIPVTFTGADSLGLIDNDFYNAWQTPMGFATGFYPSNTKRAVRFYAFELSEFGLNGSNFASIDKFVQRLSGQSDQAFVAYNTNTIQILPNNNPGCFSTMPGLWLKANDGTSTITNNQKLSQWQDRSPNDFAMEQSAIANQPQFKDATNSFNYNAYLNFDGSNRLLAPNSPFTATDNNADIFIVGRPTNTNSGKNKIIGFSRNATDATGTGSGDFPAISYDQAGRLTIDSGNVNLITSTSSNLNNIVMQQINYTQGAGGGINLLTNGAADGTASTAKHIGQWTFQIGDMSPGDDLSDFDITELIVFPQNLSATERIKIESYLAIKYGITSAHDYLAANGTTTWSISSNSGYNNNIFGIGRDDCQALHRKQSKATSTNALITIGNTAIATDNISNFNLMTNGSYSIMGDNGAALTFQTTEAPAGCYRRITREWKVKETGAVGNIFLRVPASTSSLTVKLPAESNGNMYLLVDNDGDFSTGVINIVPMTLNATNWEVSYNFADGNYYTFATDNGINTDWNDLAGPWPAASIVINGCNTNGDGLINLSDFNGSRVMVWAGPALTSEAIAATNANASADGADDGLHIPAIVSRFQNNIFDILVNSNIANTAVHYRMWIDWNADGNFGNDLDGNGNPASYAGSTTATGTGTKIVSVNVLPPAGVFSNFAVRLIVNTAAIPNNYISNSNFIYTLSNGEIEDYFFPMTVLPVTLVNFDYTARQCNVSLNWLTATELNSKEFVVERSTDGISFTAISTIASLNDPNGGAYSYTDRNLAGGDFFYRLRMVDLDGKTQYSGIVHARINCDKPVVTITPNPVKDRLTIQGLSKDDQLFLADLSGKILLRHKTASSTHTMDLSGFATGMYFISVRKDGSLVHVEKIVKL
jgi:trimeric autotransporter adhesin